ncbi:FKBP-type peptidyl-prolyl cis-trans isomerase [Arcanobacterium hippocoleae]
MVSLVFPDTLPPKDLVVQVLAEGTGRKVTEQDFVIANYTGQVWGNEKHFDSSFERGAPSGFSLQRVIPGWTKGLSGQKVGSKVVVIVPPEMGYGKSGGNANAGIGPDDVIAFYVEIADAYSLDQANDPAAKVEADLAALPVEITGSNGKPVQIKVKAGQEPPKEQQITVIARGNGELIQEKDSDIYIQYAMKFWDNSSGETTYGTSGPEAVPMGAGTMFDSLQGLPVGSRVLITIPKIGSPGSEKPGAVVVDIIGQLPHQKPGNAEDK